jgi:hypothetical protein
MDNKQGYDKEGAWFHKHDQMLLAAGRLTDRLKELGLCGKWTVQVGESLELLVEVRDVAGIAYVGAVKLVDWRKAVPNPFGEYTVVIVAVEEGDFA